MVLMRVWALLFVLSSMALWASSASDQARRAALVERVAALGQAGIRLHRTTETPHTTRYVLQVVDERNATRHLLSGWRGGWIDTGVRDEVASWLRQGRVGVRIDWDRYLKYQPHSIEVTFRGSASSRRYPGLQKWIEGGHLGAWLSFGRGDRLVRATLMPIDAHFQEENATISWRMQGYDLNVTRSHPTHQYDMATVLGGSLFVLKRSEANQTTQSVRIEQVGCQSDMKRRYEGKVECRVPLVTVRDGGARLKVSSLSLDQIIHEHNGSMVSSAARGKVDRMDLTYRDNKEEGNLTLSGVSSRLDVAMTQTIAYHTRTQLQSLRLKTKDKKNKYTQIELRGLDQNLSVEGVYNFVPKLKAMAQNKELCAVESNGTHDGQWYYEEMLGHVVHHGLGAKIDPLKIGSLHVDGAGVNASLAPSRLRVRAQLDPNTVDVRRSSAPMLMLRYLHLDGRWVLSKKDFQVLLRALPLNIKMLLMVFVHYEKDQAVFDIKFDKGHLQVNGMKVM
jgi:hypothetical protein